MKRILLIVAGLSAFLWADFSRDDATDIVTDNTTGLLWQDNSTNVVLMWEEAINYCEELTLGGYSDWRLPNQNELRSIVNKSKKNPAINNTFQNMFAGSYWSSTTVVSYVDHAWSIHFEYGIDQWDGKSTTDRVRCIRGGSR